MSRHLRLVRPHEDAALRAFIIAESEVSSRTIDELAAQLHHSRGALYRWFRGESAVNVGAVLSGPPDLAYAFLKSLLSELQPTLEVQKVIAPANDNWRKVA